MLEVGKLYSSHLFLILFLENVRIAGGSWDLTSPDLEGIIKNVGFWRAPVKMHIKDEKGITIAAFERNADGNIMQDIFNV